MTRVDTETRLYDAYRLAGRRATKRRGNARTATGPWRDALRHHGSEESSTLRGGSCWTSRDDATRSTRAPKEWEDHQLREREAREREGRYRQSPASRRESLRALTHAKRAGCRSQTKEATRRAERDERDQSVTSRIRDLEQEHLDHGPRERRAVHRCGKIGRMRRNENRASIETAAGLRATSEAAPEASLTCRSTGLWASRGQGQLPLRRRGAARAEAWCPVSPHQERALAALSVVGSIIYTAIHAASARRKS